MVLILWKGGVKVYHIDKDGTISVVRGDSASFCIDLVDANGDEYNLVQGDTLTFTVKKSAFSKTPLIQKNITGKIIDISPKDTIELPYGGYVYDVQLVTVEGFVDTVIPPRKFRVLGEVTF